MLKDTQRAKFAGTTVRCTDENRRVWATCAWGIVVSVEGDTIGHTNRNVTHHPDGIFSGAQTKEPRQ
jgi:hypothetical protein